MHKGSLVFSAIIYNRGVSFSYERLLLWDLYFSRLSRRGAESEESLESIGLLLFPAPNKSQEILTVYVSVMLWIQIQFILSSNYAIVIIPKCSFGLQAVTSNIRNHHHHCETKS